MTCVCGGELKEGFVPDFSDTAAVWAAIWVPGRPEPKGSLMQRIFTGHGVKGWDAADALALEAWRCDACGRVDLFARKPPSAGTVSGLS